MAIKELTKIEFDAFASKHEQANFHQTTNWGELKKLTGKKEEAQGVDNE